MLSNYNNRPTLYHGQIESIDDPAELHRMQVRVFEIHETNKIKVPTEGLPWLQPLFSINAANFGSSPNVGDWVLVYFPDPNSTQFGYVMGVLPGIVSETTTLTTYVSKSKQLRPVKPDGDPAGKSGFPSTPPLSRKVVAGTGIDNSNKSLIHVCDITHETNRVTNAMRRQFSEVVAAIKEAISLLLKTLGLGDPSGEIVKLIELAKDIARKIKKVTDFIKDINQTIAEFLKIVRQIRAMIAYILSLPQRLLSEFLQCLANLYKSLLASFTTSFAGVGDVGGLAELAEAVNIVTTEIQAAATQVSILTSAPQQLAAVISAPSSQADIDGAERDFASYMSSDGLFNSLVPSTSDLVPSAEATSVANSNLLTFDNGKMP